MAPAGSGLFFPGFGARAHAYADGLPDGWNVPQPPPPGFTRGSLASLRAWAVSEVVGRDRRTLVAGHSMGAALAVLAALTAPERVNGLLLIAPAGLPLHKPLRRSAADFARQLAARTYPLDDVVATARELGTAPRAAIRLIRTLRSLDLSAPMSRLRAAGVPALVVGCTTDTLVPPDQSRRVARLLGAEYRELDLPGGHVWMLRRPAIMAALLESGLAR